MTPWGLSLLLATGCVAGSETVPLPVTGSMEAFVEQAQPVFASRCANPSCHGNTGRPLSLYAVHRHRMSKAGAFLDEPLSSEELEHNLLQASLFVWGVDDASHSLLLAKPLAGHAGVEVFIDTADYDYRRLQAWIEGVLQEGGAP